MSGLPSAILDSAVRKTCTCDLLVTGLTQRSTTRLSSLLGVSVCVCVFSPEIVATHCMCAFVPGAVVLHWHVLFEFCVAHRRSLELLDQLPALVI